MFLTFLFIFLLQVQNTKILFIGDSMTSYKGGWHHQLAKKLGVGYDNFSVPGKRTDWMQFTLIEVLSKNTNYKTCFIYGGINDGFSYVKIQSTISNLQKMVDICNIHNIKPVVLVGYSPEDVMVNLKFKNAEFHVKRYIEIQNLMSGLKNCEVIPIAEGISRKDTDDGIHLTYIGHKKFAEWVYNHHKE